METSAQILNRLEATDQDKLSQIRDMYSTIELLSRLEKKITPEGMAELLESEHMGNHQWEKFINADRDVLLWYKGLDQGNKTKLIVNLMFSESFSAVRIRNT